MPSDTARDFGIGGLLPGRELGDSKSLSRRAPKEGVCFDLLSLEWPERKDFEVLSLASAVREVLDHSSVLLNQRPSIGSSNVSGMRSFMSARRIFMLFQASVASLFVSLISSLCRSEMFHPSN